MQATTSPGVSCGSVPAPAVVQAVHAPLPSSPQQPQVRVPTLRYQCSAHCVHMLSARTAAMFANWPLATSEPSTVQTVQLAASAYATTCCSHVPSPAYVASPVWPVRAASAKGHRSLVTTRTP